jgi:hypothetical protein
MPANLIHLDGRLRPSRTLTLGLERFFIDMSSFGCHLRKKSGLLEGNVHASEYFAHVGIDVVVHSFMSQANSTSSSNLSRITTHVNRAHESSCAVIRRVECELIIYLDVIKPHSSLFSAHSTANHGIDPTGGPSNLKYPGCSF